jgi:hypothetical protein
MSEDDSHSIEITSANPALSTLRLSWQTAEYTSDDGLAPMGSLHEAGDALVAVAGLGKDGMTVLGSGVMVGPGLLLTATHVLDEFPRTGSGPVFLTFLAGSLRAWLPSDVMTIVSESEIDPNRKVVSDLSLVSCTLNSAAHAHLPLMLAPMEIALPLTGERLWAYGFRHHDILDGASRVTPYVSSGRVTAAYPHGRGERMASPCIEVDMDTLGGMSGGAVVNGDGRVVGIVSSSFADGPTYVTLLWEAVRLRVTSVVPELTSHGTISLLGANALGKAKVKGRVDRDPFGDVTIKLSEAEGLLFAESISPAARQAMQAERGTALGVEELELFTDSWGAEMEAAALTAAIDALGKFSLEKVRSQLAASNVPSACLDAIDGFSVEDFDGIEDFDVKRAAVDDVAQVAIEFQFEVRALIWTLTISEAAFLAHRETFLQHFFNPSAAGPTVTLEFYQHCWFKGTMTFDRECEVFRDVATISAAIVPPRRRSDRSQV